MLGRGEELGIALPQKNDEHATQQDAVGERNRARSHFANQEVHYPPKESRKNIQDGGPQNYLFLEANRCSCISFPAESSQPDKQTVPFSLHHNFAFLCFLLVNNNMLLEIADCSDFSCTRTT